MSGSGPLPVLNLVIDNNYGVSECLFYNECIPQDEEQDSVIQCQANARATGRLGLRLREAVCIRSAI